MSALKNMLKSDTPTSSSNAGGIAGQGSHFPKDQDTTASALPSTVTGTEPSPVGPADTSAAPALQAQETKGPKAQESGHIGTVSTGDAPATGASSSQHPPATTGYLPSVGSSKDGSGSAAVGATTTYSSQHLASGDPTGSVVDHHSSDPMTYKLPEVSSHNTAGNSGVPPSAASAAASPASAASAAWARGERMPGEFPTGGYENPYKASHPLDPRVDGGKAGEVPPSSASHSTADLAIGAGAGVGAGAAAAAGGSQAFKSGTSHNSAGLAPSTLTTTTDPADRSAEYSRSADLKGLGSDASTAASTSQPQAAPQQEQGILGKALGAVGLGSAVGAAAAALGYGSKKEGEDEPRDTTAIATQPGQISQESGPPKHYRRESIPTTAYPAGPNSPTPIAPPIGGSQAPVVHGDSNDYQLGRDAAIAAGVGGGAVAASQFDKPEELPGIVAGDSSSTAPQSSGLGIGSATSGVPQTQYQDGATVRDNTATGVTPAAGSTVHDQTTTATTTGDSHTSRNLAAGGATAAALGAGTYAVRQHKEDHATGTPATNAAAGSTTLPDRTRDAPVDAVAAVPSRYDGQDAKPTTALTAESVKTQEDHTARDAAIGVGAGTGAAVAGGAEHAVDQHKEELAARKAAAEREKDLAKQRQAQQKETAKAEKQHEKELAKEQKQQEKDERKHQKELEKEEKKHQKELEKEEKKHAKEAEKQEKEREAAALEAQKRAEARTIDEDEDRMRREREAAAGVTTGAVAGATAGGMFHGNEPRPGDAADEPGYDQQHAHGEAEKHKHEKEKEKEKKPSIFRRIFKRRKNKDTGEEEEYSTDDEEDKARHAAAVGVADGSAAAATEEGSHIPHHQSEAKGRNVLGYAPERTSAEQPIGPTTARIYDSAKDPEADGRLSREPGATDDVVHDRRTDNASLGTGDGAHTIATAAGGHLPETAAEPPAEIGDLAR